MKPNIGLSEKKMNAVADILANILANQVTLYTKTRKFHWNVRGDSFMEWHKLFEKQYKQLEKAIDEVAERINKLGSHTIGTMEEFSKLTTLKEHPGKYPNSKDMLRELLEDHETCIAHRLEHQGFVAVMLQFDRCGIAVYRPRTPGRGGEDQEVEGQF